jgi:hypothetical protein
MTGSADKMVISKWRLWRQERMLDWVIGSGALADRFGDETAEVMRGEILEEFRQLVSDLPNLDPKNPLARNFLWAPAALAIYRVVLKHGGDVDDFGEIHHRASRAYMQRIPKALRPWLKRFMFSPMSRRRWEKAAHRSQARRYPDDWVFSYVEGDGKTFDLGLEFTECAVVKYAHAHGAGDEFTRSLCEGDYIQAAVLGYGLDRTKTLAWGCDTCDFRFRKDGSTSALWPPESAERTCGEAPASMEESAPVP